VSTNGVISSGRRLRRTHSDLFKAEAVGACQQQGVSIAAVALAPGVNPSLVRRYCGERNSSQHSSLGRRWQFGSATLFRGERRRGSPGIFK